MKRRDNFPGGALIDPLVQRMKNIGLERGKRRNEDSPADIFPGGPRRVPKLFRPITVQKAIFGMLFRQPGQDFARVDRDT
jgi:hypothetical protein